MDYLLKMYCFFQYEALTSLCNVIHDNWLVNIKGEVGRWIERDLLQEHYNKWLEDLASVHGGEFGDGFYRKTVALNVEAFLRLKEEFKSAFKLKRQSKWHISPHLRAEYTSLLKHFQKEELHLFWMKRSMGHAAEDLFNEGFQTLYEGKLASFLSESKRWATNLEAGWNLRHRMTSKGC